MRSSNKNDHELRRSQLVYPFGVGAIIDLPDDSVMTCSIDLWDQDDLGIKIYDKRFQNWGNVSHFRVPPSTDESKRGLPFIRFPRWRFCSKCRKLKPLSEWNKEYKNIRNKYFDTPTCYTCNIELVPIRFIIACENGHIDDFPWEKWVHSGNECSGKSDLYYKTNPEASGLAGIYVKCETCGQTKTMVGAFNKDIHENYGGCSGKKPWMNTEEYNDTNCKKTPRTVQKGGSNVYYSNVKSSILIPPYTDKVYEKINELESSDLWQVTIEKEREEDLEIIAERYNIDLNELKKIYKKEILRKNKDLIDEFKDEISYRSEEYRAFLDKENEKEKNSKNFNIEIIDGENYDIRALDKMVLVKRLREIRALVSFSRINPLVNDEYTDSSSENQSREVPLSESERVNWLPAIEVRGEGLFLKFDNKQIDKWSKNETIRNRISKINSQNVNIAEKKGVRPRIIPAKFVLLHTISHLLIRQLNFECGYSSAALRERIYCNKNDEQSEMSGILIYTSSGDSEGSLGGLVRQGKPQFFSNIFNKAIEEAKWCSSDPLCIESEGQGLNSLNLAACHACSLLPETSCEEFNKFLDRGMLIGDREEQKSGFFSN
jgi:hypothetical protein